jgi:hypothetical protein
MNVLALVVAPQEATNKDSSDLWYTPAQNTVLTQPENKRALCERD